MTDITFALLDDELGAVSFSVERTTRHLSRGETTGTTRTLSAVGCIHPGPPEMVELLPAEERIRECIAVYTSTMLSAGENYGGATFTAADRILWNGSRWRVARVKSWPAFHYCQALAVRLDEGE